MQIWKQLEKIESSCPEAVALGMFDGVHRGHRKVIEAALKYRGTYQTAVLTFTTKKIRPKQKASQRDILTPQGRLSLLEKMGVDVTYIPDFEELREMEPREFVTEILCRRLRAKVVCCGEDYRFGKNAGGDVALLQKLGEELGITVEVVSPELEDGYPVSSTRIRQCLLDGDIPKANRLLGYRYFIEGTVVYGKQLGRTMECPTINQELSPNTCIPKFGVYVSTTNIDGKEYPSITNVGKKPTIQGDRMPLAETHIIGIDRHLYGQTLRVTLYRFIREEMRFESLEELSRTIHRDIRTATLYFKETPKGKQNS